MLYTDWKKYLTDNATFSHDHFQTLLTDVASPVSPEQAFSLLPKSHEMIARAEELIAKTDFSGLYFLPKQSLAQTPDTLHALLAEHTKQVAEYLEDEGFSEEAASLLNAKIRFTNDVDVFHAAVVDRSRRVSEAGTILGDDFSDACDAKGMRPGVYEAIHFLTMNTGVTYFIMSGMIDFPINFRPLFEFYIGGGEATFYEDETLIFVPKQDQIA